MPMPLFTSGPQPIAYTLEGPAHAPVLVFSNSLGTSMDMWQPQAAALASRYRVLRYDTRGHGASATATVATADGAAPSATLEQLGGDVLRLLDALGIERASFCGISMGGLTGLWLAVHAGHRLEKLVVANSAAKIGTSRGWLERAALVMASGMDGVADGAAARWFSARFCGASPQLVAPLVDGLRHCPPAAYAACCVALAHADLRAQLGAIGTPTLLIAGAHDPVTSVADAFFMRDRIAGALCVELDASHLSSVEAAADFTRCLQDFLA